MAYNKNSQFSIFTCQRQRKAFQFKKGFTLVELLVTLTISAIVVLTIIMVYLAHFRVFINQNASFDVTSQARIAVDEIVNQVRESQAIVNTCASCGSVTTGTNSLVLQLWRLDTSGDPSDTAYDYITYSVSNNKIVKNIYPAPTSSRTAVNNKILASSILAATDLVCTYDPLVPPANYTDVSQVTVSVTATQTTTAGAKTITATQTGKAALRNKE